MIRTSIDEWLDQQRHGGLSITVGATVRSGFPGPVIFTLTDVIVAAPVTGGGWTWRAPRIALETWPLRAGTLDLDLAGRHSIAGLAGAPGVPMWVSAAEAGGRIVLELNGRLTRTSLTLRDGDIRLTPDAPPLLKVGFASAVATLPSAPASTGNSPTLPTTAHLELEARDVTPAFASLPLTTPMTRAALTADLTGSFASGPLPQVLEAWRSGGGTLEIRDALLAWPPIRIAGNGTIALDDSLQPMGAVALRVQGSVELMDTLVTVGVMEDTTASMAKLGLALMTRRNAEGVQELAVPLTLQGRSLSAGPLALGRLDAVAWPPISVP
jgi:hypothetical protein